MLDLTLKIEALAALANFFSVLLYSASVFKMKIHFF